VILARAHTRIEVFLQAEAKGRPSREVELGSMGNSVWRSFCAAITCSLGMWQEIARAVHRGRRGGCLHRRALRV